MKPIFALFLLILSVAGQVNNTKSCPSELTKGFEFPHLIIPIDSEAPDVARGTSYNGKITPTVSSIFNFDIPSAININQTLTCSLWFLFPERNYRFSGDGLVKFSRLEAPATLVTSYANAPAVQEELQIATLVPGRKYNVTSFECPAGQAIAFRLDNAGSTELDYFQDYNEPPLLPLELAFTSPNVDEG
ncbi:conserved hypothetical protein [Histoplasma capsulatum var. duboisii H88]|uniref:Ubiquitin 3 binding protein But2 C-terminal domain-containing protein n=2 Tax=Ajellomyces capsulatus TaxID=5037 RepID=F0U6B5_AJEC8|nr:conserved hypothetical protein [Histoplasma capsulatum H143]EGC41451.1 conserved hypothetical protein [Histoplasma capsulatum var. duboisii H88]